MNYLLDLKTAKFRFYFRAVQEIYLPKYKGATFRGVFGTVFKAVAEEMGFTEIYNYIFETPNDGRLPDYSSPFAPKPFVLEAPVTGKKLYKPGDEICLDLILIGKAIEYAPNLIYIFDEVGRYNGIGKWRSNGFGKFKLEKVTLIKDQSEMLYYQDKKILPEDGFASSGPNRTFKKYPAHDLLIFNFITPTHIVRKKSPIEKKAENPLTFQTIIHSLHRRLHYLYSFHQHQNIPEFHPFPVPVLEVISKNLTYERFYHFSNRQNRKVPLAGFRGALVVGGEWQPYLPLLNLGEKVHIGKETTFGLGRYILSSADTL